MIDSKVGFIIFLVTSSEKWYYAYVYAFYEPYYRCTIQTPQRNTHNVFFLPLSFTFFILFITVSLSGVTSLFINPIPDSIPGIRFSNSSGILIRITLHQTSSRISSISLDSSVAIEHCPLLTYGNIYSPFLVSGKLVFSTLSVLGTHNSILLRSLVEGWNASSEDKPGSGGVASFIHSTFSDLTIHSSRSAILTRGCLKSEAITQSAFLNITVSAPNHRYTKASPDDMEGGCICESDILSIRMERCEDSIYGGVTRAGVAVRGQFKCTNSTFFFCFRDGNTPTHIYHSALPHKHISNPSYSNTTYTTRQSVNYTQPSSYYSSDYSINYTSCNFTGCSTSSDGGGLYMYSSSL